MKQTPILFLGDSPSISGGLSRIGRDLAYIVSKMEEFRVGFLGRGGLPSKKLPFMQYTFPDDNQWGEELLQGVWDNFAGGEQGVLFTIWDPSRLLWLSSPGGMPNESWLRRPPFKKWGYFPIDHEGPGGRLSVLGAAALKGYDRWLGYGEFGSTVIQRTLGLRDAVDWIPHGVNLEVFQPRDKDAVRAGLGVDKGVTMIGVVMTNQTRKDWGLTFEIINLLKQQTPKLRVWCKTDSIDRHWDLRTLSADFGVQDVVIIDLAPLTDSELSYMYSACDLTMLPSLGEGFGYPIVESLACGVPCVHGTYAGGMELIQFPMCLVSPRADRYDTRHNCRRPVYRATDWVEAVGQVLGHTWAEGELRASVEHLDWSKLHTVWERWFREGVQ